MKLEIYGSRLDKVIPEGEYEIVVPDGVKMINNRAFTQCTETVRVILPDSVTEIGGWAFEGCAALEEIELGAGVNMIGWCAFGSCTALKSITLPASVNAISSSAFAQCGSLKEIVIPAGVTSLVSTFEQCKALERVVLPEGLKEIGYHTFRGCTALKEIALPEGLNVIGAGAFMGCASLTELSIPRSVTSIGERAFEGCAIPVIEKDGLKYMGGEHVLLGAAKAKSKLVIPENVTVMMYGAFAGCKYLTEVTVGENLDRITGNAFENCTALKKVTLPAKMKYIGSRAFHGCKKLTEISIDAEEIGSHAFQDCASLERVTLAEGVKHINDAAFSGCPQLAQVQLPSTLVSVRGYIFKGCISLKRLVFGEGLQRLDAETFLECAGLEEVNIPASVTEMNVGYWNRPKESANLRYVEIAGTVELDKREEYGQSRARGVWEILRMLDTVGICLKDMAVDAIPAAVRKRAVIGYAEAVMRGVAIDEEISKGYEAYIKKNKTKLAEDAAANPALLRLMMSRQLLAADKLEMVIKGLGGNQELIAEVTAYRDSTFSAADKAKTKAKAKAGDDARAQRLADADAGKGGLTFVSAVDFDYWQHGGKARYFHGKDELEQFLGRRGMKLAATPNGKTDFLIVSNKIYETTAKMEKAKKLGIPFITEAELLAKKDVWKELDLSLSADGKTYTFDASAEFAHAMLTDGTIPETVETINLSVVAVNRGKTEGEAISAELSKKIRFTDLKRTGIDYSAITQYIYTKIGRDTLEEYYALMGKEKYYDVLAKIFAWCCNPISDETEANEEALEGMQLTALGEEIVNVMRAFLFGGREYTLTYAATAHPVSEKVLMVLMMSLAYRWVKKETKCGSVLVNAWEMIGSKETELFGLMNRTQLRAMLADFFPMYDGAEHVDKEVARVAAIKLCGVDTAKGMMATVRELERKQSGFGISQVRWDLMNSIRAKLGATEDNDVLMYLDKVKHLDWAVNARGGGVKEEELRAELLASVDLGLDEENGLTLDYGARQIRAQLQTDLAFTFVDLSKNKTMRALPKAAKNDDTEKAAAAQEKFKSIRELIKTISVIYLNKIKEMYYQGTSMKKSKWDEMFMSRQISLRTAHGVLWGVFDKDDTLKTAFCVKGNKCFDVDGNEISIPKTALIGVVDLAQLDAIDRAAWRKYFSQDEIPQPVKQVWQPLCMISVKDVEKRYMGCHIGEGPLQGLGWDIYAEDGQDTGVHSEYITAEIDYWSRHGMIYGTGNVTEVKVHIDHDIGSMTDHEKRWWNQSVQKLDYYLKPESKAADAIRSGDVSQVREWVECGLISADNLSEMIDVSTEASQTSVTAYLLELSQELRTEDQDDEWVL